MVRVNPPTVVGRSEPRSQSALNFRSVTLDPPPDGEVIGVQAPLGQEFLYVAIREREAQIPTDGQENHLRFKLAPLEQDAKSVGPP